MSTNGFGDFDQFSAFSSLTPDSSKNSAGTSKGACGWHWPQTVLSLALVSGLAFLMAFLTRNVSERSVFVMGLIFLIPTGAMFLAALIMEFSLSAMTPSVSRNAQVKIAVITSIAIFVIACLCNAVYLYGGFVGDSADNLMFLVYQNDSEGNSSIDQDMMEVLDELHARSGKRVQVGLFKFDFHNKKSGQKNDTAIPLAPFTRQQRDTIYAALIKGETIIASSYGHDYAYEMIEESGTTKHTRVIFICETAVVYGDGTYTQAEWDRDLERMRRADISISFMGHGLPDKGMRYMVENTGGKMVTDYSADDFMDYLKIVTRAESDILRSSSGSAKLLTGIMLMLEGLVIGFGLTLLLSVEKQRRWQLLISPLMAVAAFVLVKFLPLENVMPQWVKEGIAFSLLGIVLMNKNYPFRDKSKTSIDNTPGFENGGFDAFGSGTF